MRTRIAWSLGISLVLFCGALLIQNLRLARQIEGLRIELAQKETPVVASEEPKTLKMDLDELDQLRKNNSELIRLRNKFGLLQNELAELRQQKADLLREQQPAERGSEEQTRTTVLAKVMNSLGQQLTEHQLDLERKKALLSEASKNLRQELAGRLNISEGETRGVSLAELTPGEIELLGLYHDSERDFENTLRVVKALTDKLAQTKIEFSSVP